MLKQRSNINANLRFEFNNTLLGEDMRDDFALAGMFVTVPGIEYTPLN